MSKIEGKDTSIEKIIRSGLHIRGFRFRKHVNILPGKPNIVFTKVKVVIFIDGDFWHGFRSSLWQNRLPSYWHAKIKANQERDKRIFRKLRNIGWKVIR